ncbi:UNVERIFIED_CONTAM: 5'-3' exoribonuclease 2 [Gekko kuhli]
MLKCRLLFPRNSGATPLLAWNRMPHSQGPPYQQNQYQGPGAPMNYPQRPSDRRERGRQGYGRPYPLPPSSGRYNWN